MTQAGNPTGTDADGVSPVEPEFDLKTSSGGRGYVAWYFATVLKRHDFSNFINERLAADFACALSQSLADQAQAVLAARNAESHAQRELAALSARLQEQGDASAVQLDDDALVSAIGQHADLAGRICLTHEDQNGGIKPTVAERKADIQNSLGLASVPLQAPPAGAYNAKQIAWELERTALNDGFYGNALRVAKDIPWLHPEDVAVLDRYATGMQTGTDHVMLQNIALRVYNGSADKASVAPPERLSFEALARAGFAENRSCTRVELPKHIHDGLQADVDVIPGMARDVQRG